MFTFIWHRNKTIAIADEQNGAKQSPRTMRSEVKKIQFR